MVTPRTGRPKGRPSDPEKREAIVHAGWSLFLARGVEGVAVDAIASSAGVSKATLYKHFRDKPAIFEAGVLREMERIEAAQALGTDRGEADAFRDVGALAETLQRFGFGLMSFLVSDPAVDFYNALSGELRRHPELARRFYAMGPGHTRANLSAILAEASRRGLLRVTDAEVAAEHLFGMWQGFTNFQLSLDVESEVIRTTLDERVAVAISVFMKAYSV